MAAGGQVGTMKRTQFAIVMALALAGMGPVRAPAAQADGRLSAKLEADQIGVVDPGIYEAGETVRFALTPWGHKYLLRFEDEPETFVLTAAHAPMGARVLKYDTGVIALSVSGWGAITLYTDAKPSGIPAVRTADAPPAPVISASLNDLENAAHDEAAHLNYVREVKLVFLADWNKLANEPASWTPAFETITNTARGIEYFTRAMKARQTLAQSIDAVRLQSGSKPALTLTGKTLVVTFAAENGYAGRPSSRAVARGLSKALSVPLHRE